MDLLSLFLPQVIEKVNSPINGEIQVIKYLGNTKIIVNKMLQSGGLVRLIWEKGINKIVLLFHCHIVNCLILGLGGGSVAQIINTVFPKAKITGIEIDPAMIELGKKYFNLNKIKNLKIIRQDAIKLITNHQSPITNHYSLILVDLYLGSQIPPDSESIVFLKNLKKQLSKNGIIIFNRLFYGKNRKLTEKFTYKLEKHFSKIELLHAWSNLLVVSRV